jgi:hypothetical protein
MLLKFLKCRVAAPQWRVLLQSFFEEAYPVHSPKKEIFWVPIYTGPFYRDPVSPSLLLNLKQQGRSVLNQLYLGL